MGADGQAEDPSFTFTHANPFSDVSSLEMSSSSSGSDGDEDADLADSLGEDSSTHSDSSSQIVSSHHQPRQRVRLLATFRLSSLSSGAPAAHPPTTVALSSAAGDGNPLPIFQASHVQGQIDASDALGGEGQCLSTSATVHTFQSGVPRMVVLDKETDLTIPPAELQHAGSRSASRQMQLITAGPAEYDSAAMTDALAALAGLGPEATDFVASASTMKTIFCLAHTNANVTVAVHRVDKTLVLNGVINGKSQNGGRDVLPDSLSRSWADHGSGTASPRIMADGSNADGVFGDIGGDGECSGQKKVRRRKKKNREERCKKREAAPGGGQAEQLSTLYSKFMYYSASARDDPAEPTLEKDIEEGLIQTGCLQADAAEEGVEAPLQAEAACSMPGTGASNGDVDSSNCNRHAFRRAVHFQFHNLNLLLGSDTVIFNRGAQTSELSLRLQDIDNEVPKLTCLDYWLDNIFAQVPIALKKGLIIDTCTVKKPADRRIHLKET